MPDGGYETARAEMATSGERSRLPLVFWAILAVGLLLRVAAFELYAAHHPDESIQYLEQAHRLVFGYGVVPWEFRYFIRSWLIPLALAGPMQLGEWLSPGGIVYLVLPRALVAAFNSVTIIAAWFIGARTSRRHAIVAMAVVALWVESVLFSVQTLSESMAIACFLPAAALVRRDASTRALIAAGALMALAGLARYQLGIAIALFALLSAGREWRVWRAFLMGGIPVIAMGAIIDLTMGLFPYEWIVNGYQEVVVKDRMTSVGGDLKPWLYLQAAVGYWGAMAPLIVVLSFLAGRRFALLMVAAWANVLVHQLVGHKEWRYLYFSIEILLVLAAIGSLNLASRFVSDVPSTRRDKAILAGLVAAWALASAVTAQQPAFSGWRTSGDVSALGAQAGRMRQICGLSVPNQWSYQFGYHVVHRPIPLFLHPVDQKTLRSEVDPATVAGFNAVIVPAASPAPAGFDRNIGCGGDGGGRLCLYVRAGGCTPNEASGKVEFQHLLLKADM